MRNDDALEEGIAREPVCAVQACARYFSNGIQDRATWSRRSRLS